MVGREAAVELIVLAAVAGEHVLLVGPPGTAKSEVARRVAAGLGGRYFEYVIGRFTEPNEIFGPIDLRRLREGIVETQTAGMLPEADIAFLDEVFLGSTAILNSLLGILNERVFRRGHSTVRCPLRVCVAATNALPEDPRLAAFADRFLVQTFFEPTGDAQLETLLEAGWAMQPVSVGAAADLRMLDEAIAGIAAVEMGAVRPFLAEAIRVLRNGGIGLSDRRIVKLQRLVAAACVLDGRQRASEADLWPLVYTVSGPDLQARARALLHDLLGASKNAALASATEHASLGPLARATRIQADADALLAEVHTEPSQRRRWRLKLEAVAREVDATFPEGTLPPSLIATREAIVQKLAEVPYEAEHQ